MKQLPAWSSPVVRLAIGACFVVCCVRPATVLSQDDIFRSHVRTTDPLTPDQERLKLSVPEGFKVTLFASEPQIQKPLNMAFDADGRLWVTGSNMYPFPAEGSSGTDCIRVLEDTDGDGAADHVTTFADDLNIPMGLYPWRDGVVVFSIPNILFLRDTDGDGKADKRTVLYGPFDTTRDTHGMNNAFRRGFDGWLYCCHGFNNQSQVAGTDGNEVTMHSGNTYRIRLDGSRIEHFTHGQVNPFGMTMDANGDLFTSDCHTKPVTLLIRDGYYESFGKPHDGLGFVPAVMEHLHGSTAIDALCQYQGTVFPEDFHDDIFVGNVMTSRVHRNSIVRTGSSVRMKEENDFLTSEDPWFRPVDIQVGPDGALYVADFYNRIIGHYEVPLDHQGRDRERARIWKVSFIGTSEASASPASAPQNLTDADISVLISALNDPRRPFRQHAADQIVDRIGTDAASALHSALESRLSSAERQTAAPQLLWSLHRLEQLEFRQLASAFDDGAERTRLHAMRICSEMRGSEDVFGLIRRGLRDAEPMVQRAAADAASRHPSILLAKEVINATVVSPDSDVHLKHALKIALRNQLRSPAVSDWFNSSTPPAVAAQAVVEILPGLTAESVGDLAVGLLRTSALKPAQQATIVKHAAQYCSDRALAELTETISQLPNNKIEVQAEIWSAMSEALRLRKNDPPKSFVRWSEDLAARIFRSIDLQDISWGQYSLAGEPSVKWGLEPRRPSARATKTEDFLSSLPGGEKGVGVLRSRSFVLPFSMEIRVCGHLGFPDRAPVPENRVLLRAAETGEVLRSVLAPRNDTARTTEWNLAGVAGQPAYLEVIDGIGTKAYAWIGIGRPTPAVVNTNDFDGGAVSSQLASAVKIIRDQQSSDPRLAPEHLNRMQQIAGSTQLDGAVRSLAAQSLLVHFGETSVLAVADLLQIATTPKAVEKAILKHCRGPADEAGVYSQKSREELIRFVFARIDRNLRNRLVLTLSETAAGAGLLMTALQSGTPSAEILRDERVVQQLGNFGAEMADRVKELRAALPPETAAHQELTANVLRHLRLGNGDAEKGEAVFRKHCVACHRRAGEGGVAGPQLDGIGTRGAARLLEDILSPNLNVDVAFRTSTLVLNDGRVVSGIVRKTPPPSVLLKVIGADGKTKDVSGDDIEERKDSVLSLMPANVASTMTEDELVSLVAWLLK